MKIGIIGKKLGMTQIFDEKGNVIPVTLIEAGPCVVAQKKTIENDGYEAVQLAYEDTTKKHVNKAQLGHFEKAGISPKRHLKEFRRVLFRSGYDSDLRRKRQCGARNPD